MNDINQSFKCAHIIYTPFTGVGLHGGFRGEKWLEKRIYLFKNYCLKSLLNQTNREFIHWISFRPEEAQNPKVSELAEYLKSLNYAFFFTFDGLMYWDDKFTDYGFRSIVRNFLMMVWDCVKHKEIKNPIKMLRYTINNKNKTLVKRLGFSLSKISGIIGRDYDWVYMTRIDSDDMFSSSAIQEIQDQLPEDNKALIFLKGYGYNIVTGQLADWKSPENANPPYHTILFKGDIFFDAAKHKDYYGSFKSHEDIPKVFKPVYLSDNSYCFTMHGSNISTYWTSYLMKIQNDHVYNEYFGDERKDILKKFGIIG